MAGNANETKETAMADNTNETEKAATDMDGLLTEDVSRRYAASRRVTDRIDMEARRLVQRYFAAHACQDEKALRLSLVSLVAEADIPEHVANEIVWGKGLRADFVTDLAGRLYLYLYQDVLEKLDISRLASCSLCGWARALLRRQARTALRSEIRSRRAEPRDNLAVEQTARPETGGDDIDEAIVLEARETCGPKNMAHLMEFFLRRHYGFKPPVRLAVGPATPRLPGTVGPRALVFAAMPWWSDTDVEALPSEAVEVVVSSAVSLRYTPPEAVARVFTALVERQAPPNGSALARAWLAKWAEASEDGLKDEGSRNTDVLAWEEAVLTAAGAKVFEARSPDELEAILENFFWVAHSMVRESLALTPADVSQWAAR